MGIKAAFQQLAVCSTTWSSGISYGAQQLCVCEIETQFQVFFLLSVFRCYSLLKLGSVYSLGYKLYLWKKVWKMLLDAKKKIENWIKRATGYLQFFLEDALSIVTAYARIGSRCKVNCIFHSESELSIHSLLSHYWLVYWMCQLYIPGQCSKTCFHIHVHMFHFWGNWMNGLRAVELIQVK